MLDDSIQRANVGICMRCATDGVLFSHAFLEEPVFLILCSKYEVFLSNEEGVQLSVLLVGEMW